MGKVKQAMLAEIEEPSATEVWQSMSRITMPLEEFTLFTKVYGAAHAYLKHPHTTEFLEEAVVAFEEFRERHAALLAAVSKEMNNEPA